jgi:hypothetical protein
MKNNLYQYFGVLFKNQENYLNCVLEIVVLIKYNKHSIIECFA